MSASLVPCFVSPTLPPLPLSTLLSVQLRLAQRIIVSAGSGKQKREASVGLKAHADPSHNFSCERFGARCRVDWHGEGEHPGDFLEEGICPARYHNPILQSAVYDAIAIEDLPGGLNAYVGVALALLPYRLVEFYLLALGARDRFVAERDAAQARLFTR